MATDPQHTLLDIFRFFPGISSASNVRAVPGGGVVLAMAFDDDVYGTAARMVVEIIAGRVRAERDDGETWRCDATQAQAFLRSLSYASQRPMGAARPPAKLSAKPLPTLLSHALIGFEQEYDTLIEDEALTDGETLIEDEALAEGQTSAPHLGVWANVLRVIGDDGLDLRDLGTRAILAKRAVRVVVRDLEAQGWLKIEKATNVRGPKMLRLTAAGQQARTSGERLAAAVEERWRRRYGAARIDGLRAALAAIADSIAVELPHYLTGYGPGDGAITGGPYLAEEPGPPRIPARGEEWPVVLRQSKAAELPLFALVSIVLAAFAIDYERERLGDLRSASTLLQDVVDEGVPLERVRKRGVTGSGRSTPERHLLVVVARRKRGAATQLVYPTPKARRIRDSYPHLVMEIERNWQAGHGAQTMATLRTELAHLNATLNKPDQPLPAFPDPMRWFRRLHQRNP